jgi:hypothetical protein
VRNWPYPAHLGTSHLSRTLSSITTNPEGMILEAVAPALKATSMNSEKRLGSTFFIKTFPLRLFPVAILSYFASVIHPDGHIPPSPLETIRKNQNKLNSF